MSLILWNKLPYSFLNMKFKRWSKLDRDVQALILELANEQKFKCALCSRDRDLIVEHDHDPEYGPGKPITIHNIRGLACQRCNWHLMVYEKDKNGEYRGFDEVYSNVSDREWESYIYAYECRVGALREARLEKEYRKIRTPLQFIKALSACVQFVKGEMDKDPGYQPPENFLKAIFRIKPFLDELQPIIEARMLELGETNKSAA